MLFLKVGREKKTNRSINRSSIYRLKPTVYYSVKKICENNNRGEEDFIRLKKLLPVWKEMVQEEETDRNATIAEPEWHICDGCGADIFNRRYHCGSCRSGDYDLCVLCYQSFGKDHYHKMELLEKYPLQSLRDLLNQAEQIIATLSI